ncbi:hypothetical protein ACFFIY_07620 [Bhargavaea ullalensis]|uniref:Lipoprotein n=1 Tax=Bhargavaea ullalensis TaxID=1265685 RepID=A0ABV2GAY9_9BACL
MWKKAAPALLATAAILGGCNTNNDALPPDNETPMEDINNGNDMMPNDRNNNGNNGMDNNGTGTGGIDRNNNNGGTNGPIDRDGTGPGFGEFNDTDTNNGTMNNDQNRIMEDDLNRNGNGK